mmetsp:Transcript_6264/g.17530  ORF Transcript_6264/g.17530 Transcript_6264/m.17530 type:complete len:260 (+) Transcript_6264:92-871(+)
MSQGKEDEYEIVPVAEAELGGAASGAPSPRSRRSIFTQRAGKELEWENVNFTVAKGTDEKVILSGVWGKIPAGTICALMGPSGAGKTSLLNLLAGRLSSNGTRKVSGTVKVGSKEINPVENRANIAYVMQDDSLLPTTTPREALRFSAAFRLEGNVTEAEREELVTTMLQELGLTDCADTMVGGEMITGISGGQRKRTSVGVDLITNPKMVFPTSPPLVSTRTRLLASCICSRRSLTQAPPSAAPFTSHRVRFSSCSTA